MRGWIGPISVAGIPVKVHLLALVLPLLLAGFVFKDPDAGSVLGRVLLFDVGLVCVFAHEMGHALAARRRGMKVAEVLIHPFGGMAIVERRLPPRWRARDDASWPPPVPRRTSRSRGCCSWGRWPSTAA
jgi:Zn-dependent protease